jgi:hypothetical protein
MAFADYVYESDLASTFQVRLDTDNAAVAGGVIGPSDIPAHVKVSSTGREFGVRPRFITAKRLVGAPPNQFSRSTRLVICTEAVYDGLQVGAAVVLNGIGYTVSSKTPETYG